MRGIARQASRTASSLRRMGDSAEYAERRLHRLARRLRMIRSIRYGMTGTFAGLGTGLLAHKVGSTLIGYEKSMAMVKAHLTSYRDDAGNIIFKGFEKVKNSAKASSSAMSALRAETQKVAQVTIFDPKEVAAGLLELARAGFNAIESKAILHPVVRLAAAAGDLSVKAAVDIATNITKGFNLALAKTTDVVDVLATAASNANTTVQQIGQAMKFAAPSAVAAGRSIEEVTSTLMALAKRGLKDSIGGTSIARMLESIYKRSGPAVKALKSIGLTHKAFLGDGGKSIPIAEMLEKFQTAANKFGKEKVIMAIQAMMGSRGGRAAKLLYESGVGEIKAGIKLLEAAKGRAKLMEEVMMSNIYGAYEKMRASLVTSIIKLGEGGLSADLEYLAGQVKALADGFSNLSPTWKQATGRALLFAAAITAIGIPIGVFLFSISSIAAILATLLSPLGLIIAGVSALAFWLSREFDIGLDDVLTTLKNIAWAVQNPLDALKRLGEITFDALKSAIADLGNYIAQQLVGPLSQVISFLSNPLKGAWNIAKSATYALSGMGQSGLSYLGAGVTPVTGKSLAQSEADKQMALNVRTDTNVKVDAPGSIKLLLPNGQLVGTIPITTSSDKGRTHVDSAASLVTP